MNNEDTYESNNNMIIDYQLAFENYALVNNYESKELNELYKKIGDYYNMNKKDFTLYDLIDIQSQILNDCIKLVDLIGKDNFIFSDNSIEYKL